jgi:hypothetical protein
MSTSFFIEEPPKKRDFGARLIDLCVEGNDYSIRRRVGKEKCDSAGNKNRNSERWGRGIAQHLLGFVRSCETFCGHLDKKKAPLDEAPRLVKDNS